MYGWMLQWYVYVPAMAKTRVESAFATPPAATELILATLPGSVSNVTVWFTSWNTKFMVEPTAIVSGVGVKKYGSAADRAWTLGPVEYGLLDPPPLVAAEPTATTVSLWPETGPLGVLLLLLEPEPELPQAATAKTAIAAATILSADCVWCCMPSFSSPSA
jgi:hypothetical protein